MALREGKSGSGEPGRRPVSRGEGGGLDETGGSGGGKLIDSSDPQEVESIGFSN